MVRTGCFTSIICWCFLDDHNGIRCWKYHCWEKLQFFDFRHVDIIFTFQGFETFTGWILLKLKIYSEKPWLRSSWESKEIEYWMVEGSGVTVLHAGLQSWHTSIQLKPVQSFFQMPRVNFGKACQNLWMFSFRRVFEKNRNETAFA